MYIHLETDENTEGSLRNRIVILMGVIVAVVFAAWFVFLPKESARVVTDAGARVETPEAAPPAASPPTIATPDPTPIPAAPPSAAPRSSAVAIADAAPTDLGTFRPEPLPEIDAFSKTPPGSDRWTPEQLQHHRDGLFENLARREAQLERELAAGDARTKEQKRVTLEYLRARRDELLAGTRTRPPRNDAEP